MYGHKGMVLPFMSNVVTAWRSL